MRNCDIVISDDMLLCVIVISDCDFMICHCDIVISDCDLMVCDCDNVYQIVTL